MFVLHLFNVPIAREYTGILNLNTIIVNSNSNRASRFPVRPMRQCINYAFPDSLVWDSQMLLPF